MKFEKKLTTRWVLAALAMMPMVAAQADDVKAKPSQQVTVKTLEEVVVYGQANQGLSHKNSIKAAEMRDMPIGNGNITDLLEMNPNVRYAPLKGDQNGMQSGEIKPQDIEINGADANQTAFFIDNVNMNNDIGYDDGVFDGAMQTVPGVASNQAYIFDAMMLSSVDVYDRNISASLGGFEGGAVVAKTKQYSGEDRFSVNYRTTSDKWMSMHLDDNAKVKLKRNLPSETGFAQLQPKFKKHMANALWEKGLTEDLGMVVGFSRRQSSITQNRFHGFTEGPQKAMALKQEDHKRFSDNFLLNLKWTPTVDDRFELGTRYSSYRETRIWPDAVNNNVEDEQRAFGGTLSWIRSFQNGVWTNTVALDRIENRRESGSATNVYHTEGDIAWLDGGYGDSSLRQTNTHFSTEYAFDPIDWGRVEHSISVGGILQNTRYSFNRPQVVHGTTLMEDWFGGDDPIEMKSNTPAGKVKTSYTNTAVYAEDRMTFGRLTMRPGVRLERDTFLNHTNLSPRFSSQFEMTPDWRMSLGWNRYYGRSFSSMKLANGILALNGDVDHVRSFERLKTPNAVEFTLGTEYDYRNAKFGLSYVKRSYKDPIQMQKDDQNRSFFTNGAGYGAEVYTIDASNRHPVKLGGSVWNAQMALDYTRIRRDQAPDPGALVILDNQLMTQAAMDRLVNNNRGEWIARLNINTAIPKYNLTMTNRFVVEGPQKGYQELEDAGTGSSGGGFDGGDSGFDDFFGGDDDFFGGGSSQPADPLADVPKYYSYDYGVLYRWDMSFKYEPTFLKKHSAFVQFEIDNVLDKRRKIVTVKKLDNFGDLGQYTPGRQFWLRLGMTW